MRAKIGYWRTGMSVSMDQEGVDLMAHLRKGLEVEVTNDRHVLIPTSGHRGAKIRKVRQDSAGDVQAFGRGVFGHAEVEGDLLVWPRPDFELPRFERTWMEFEFSYGLDGWLSCEPLAADHLLPWPRLCNDRSRMTHPELLVQCYLRIRSGIAAGLSGRFDEVGVPLDVLQDHLRGGHWLKMQEKARRELGVPA